MSKRLDRAMREFELSRARLETEQGRIARRNARRAALAALRKIRSHLDEDYPNIATENPKPRRRKRKRSEHPSVPPDGWVFASTYTTDAYKYDSHRRKTMEWQIVAACAEAGVRTRKHFSQVIVPDWVAAVGSNVSKLKEAKNNVSKRKAVLAAKLIENLSAF